MEPLSSPNFTIFHLFTTSAPLCEKLARKKSPGPSFMFVSQRPAIHVPESLTCVSSATLTPPRRLLSPTEGADVVRAAIEHLSARLTGDRFTVSPSVAVGTQRQVLTVSALDRDEAFVVKVSDTNLVSHDEKLPRTQPPTFRAEWVKRHIALEEEVPFDGHRLVSVAPFVRGETFLSLATQRGLSEREWDIGYTTIPTLMRAIWRESRSPDDPALGLLLDHHFDNIVVGGRQPPFHDRSCDTQDRFVFVDGRNDGLYHPESALEDAIEDFRVLFKRYAFVRSSWA